MMNVENAAPTTSHAGPDPSPAHTKIRPGTAPTAPDPPNLPAPRRRGAPWTTETEMGRAFPCHRRPARHNEASSPLPHRRIHSPTRFRTSVTIFPRNLSSSSSIARATSGPHHPPEPPPNPTTENRRPSQHLPASAIRGPFDLGTQPHTHKETHQGPGKVIGGVL